MAIQDFFPTLWSNAGSLVWLILFINSVLIIITVVFVQRKRPESMMVWILAFLILPVVFVLIFYVLFGRDYHHKKMFSNKAEADREVANYLLKSKGDYFITDFPKSGLGESELLARMLFTSNQAFLTKNNEVQYYNLGDDLFKDMLEEIRNAKRFVHMECYIIRKDALGKEFADVLAAKAREGVEVKLLMDGVGCHKLPRRFFKELRDAGGKTAEFFPSIPRRVNIRFNNRNHRKILMVDGDTAFIGGYNIGLEYKGLGPLGYWRDDMVRIKGMGAISVEKRFVLDWNFAAKDELKVEDYKPTLPGRGKVSLQIVSGGPDTEAKPIMEQYLRMISSAKEYVYIQTPYFVPTEPISAALVAAAKAGVDVRIMIPSKSDYPFVYWASLSNVGQMLSGKVRVHQFRKDGFIHAKIMVVDDRVTSIGSANFDRRSFELNFENNAVVYDQDFARKVKAAYIDDVAQMCSELTLESYGQRSNRVKFMEAISRFYTPVA